MRQLEFDDIQALIFAGYGSLRLSRYVFLHLEDAALARGWLRELVEAVTTERFLLEARERGAWLREAVHVAFTARGLEALGLEGEVLCTFSPEFQEGMVTERRSRILGDVGGSAPARWEFGGRDGAESLHLVLMLFAEGEVGHEQALEELHARHRRRYVAHGLREVFVQEAHLIPVLQGDGTENGFREPFGFRDGIAHPTIEGSPHQTGRTAPIKAGEFILGYTNGYGELPDTPTVPAGVKGSQFLPEAPGESGRKDLGRNGTYLVLRKLRQDVEGFSRFVREKSRELVAEPSQEEAGAEWLAAKLMGRWRSGAPLALCPARDEPELGADPHRNNAFLYAKEDPRGLRCPIGSHVRRSNPRDGLVAGEPDTSLKVADLHHILRRGRPYEDEAGEQGTLFVALNASLRRQFEFIQQSWIDSPRFGRLYDSRDPITGNSPETGDTACGSSAVTIPAEPAALRLTGLPRFVHVRGGDYFFLPGLQALRFLAAG